MLAMTGRVCVVTGAAGGIGASVCRRLAREGATLAVWDRQTAALRELERELEVQGTRVLAQVVDLFDLSALDAALARTVADLGRIDVLVNVAAVMSTRPLLDVTAQEWDQIFGVNLRALFFLLQGTAKHMIAREQGGSIVNLASTAARAPRPIAMAYAASKAGVVSVTRSAAVALAPYGIRVNAVCPGLVQTPMLEGIRAERSRLSSRSPEQIRSDMERSVPMGRLATPDEVAQLVAFLAGDQSAYITGEAVGVTGGTDGTVDAGGIVTEGRAR